MSPQQQTMLDKSWAAFQVFLFFLLSVSLQANALNEDVSGMGTLVKRDQRISLIKTEHGEISAANISDGARGSYHLQFITLEPNSLFLPVLLHADMVFYVHSGSGILSWGDERGMRRTDIKRGDVYRLEPGSVFFVQSDLEPEREKLRIYAIFSSTDENIYEPSIGAYSTIRDLILCFDSKVLQAGFKVPEEVIEAIRNSTEQAAIVQAMPTKKTTFWELEAQILRGLVAGSSDALSINGKKKKAKTFNMLDAKPDFENCNGWSLTVNRRNMHLLKGSGIGVFMVNLTKGSMMGPHWNPMATEIAVVLHGEGMIRVACPSNANESECKYLRFKVEEGDAFAVHRFHPMTQMSFNNDTFVFMGFSTTIKRNYQQFLAGKVSVLQAVEKWVLALSLNVSDTTIDQLLGEQADSIILDCTSCAEIEERRMEQEMEKEKQEKEAKEKEEQEERKKEEEKKRQEEEARKEKEEEKRQGEEEEEKREEEKKRQEEEAKKHKEEEGKWQREEEEEKREEEKKRQEEDARKEKEEEEKRQREEEEEEEKRRREEEAKREQEEARRHEQEEKARKQREKEEQEQQEETKSGGGEEEEGGGKEWEGLRGKGRKVLPRLLKV